MVDDYLNIRIVNLHFVIMRIKGIWTKSTWGSVRKLSTVEFTALQIQIKKEYLYFKPCMGVFHGMATGCTCESRFHHRPCSKETVKSIGSTSSWIIEKAVEVLTFVHFSYSCSSCSRLSLFRTSDIIQFIGHGLPWLKRNGANDFWQERTDWQQKISDVRGERFCGNNIDAWDKAHR